MKMRLAFSLLLVLTFICCKQSSSLNDQVDQNKNITNTHPTDSSIVYQTSNLIIKRLSNHIYVHISYLNTNDFGKVACNGILVINEHKVVVFDTPTDNDSSLELLNFVTNELKSEIIALVPTHFHNDCIGGIAEFETHGIPTYASVQTLELLNKNGQKFSKPIIAFDDNLTLAIGNKNVYADYFGEGHSKDNVVGYFPGDNAVFGGCLIKEIGASKGYLGDANTKEWSATVKKVKLNYPNAKIVIPGHGNWGGIELFDYTIKLFE